MCAGSCARKLCIPGRLENNSRRAENRLHTLSIFAFIVSRLKDLTTCSVKSREAPETVPIERGSERTTHVSEEPILRLDGLTKHFGDQAALREASFAVERGEYVALLGPSGSGKTTLLRTIAGFETPAEAKSICRAATSRARQFMSAASSSSSELRAVSSSLRNGQCRVRHSQWRQSSAGSRSADASARGHRSGWPEGP